MHSVKLTITDDIFEKFMGLVDILPKESIEIEEIDAIPVYPAISFEEAREKVEKAVHEISQHKGRDADSVFKEILSQ